MAQSCWKDNDTVQERREQLLEELRKAEQARELLEAVMNSSRNSLGMQETEIAREPSRLWNPHFYAIFAQVHNTL
jgi:uncharacterized protein YigA (DUF484 family)